MRLSFTLPWLLLALLGPVSMARAQAPAAAPPSQAAPALPPTMADLVLLLRSYQPDTQRIQRLREQMEAPLPASAEPADLAAALHAKALVAEELQEHERRTAWLQQALPYARQARLAQGAVGHYLRVRYDLAVSLSTTRGVAASQESMLELVRELRTMGQPPLLASCYFHVISNYVHLADLDSAHTYLGQADALLRELSNRSNLRYYMPLYHHLIEQARGFFYTRQGRLEEAERAYLASLRQGEQNLRYNEIREAQGQNTLTVARILNSNDSTRIFLAQTYIAQQRLDEAELLLREVLKSALSRNGRNSAIVGRALWSLATVSSNRGHYAQAAVLAEWGDRALQEAGISESSSLRLNGRQVWASALVSAGRPAEAVRLLDAIRGRIDEDDRLEEGFGQGTLMSVQAYLQVGRTDDALQSAERLLRHHARHYGTDHYYTAEARAYRAMALRRGGRADEARREFARAVQTLADPQRVVGRQQASLARTRRLRHILNEYLDLLAGRQGAGAAADVAEAFRLADVARWQSVQKALAGSALRAAAGSPELGALIKRVQDADDELQAVYKNLITQRSAPPEQQLPAVIKAMEQRIAELQRQQQRDQADIRRQFPQYDELLSPRPADWTNARRALRPREALLSLYVTPAGTYVWAGSAQGDLRFHFSPRQPDWIAAQVRRVRDSVDLSSGAPIERLRFDLEAAHALYQELLAPVQSAWAQADTLLVVANEALGQIPLSLLPTGPAPDEAGAPPDYRRVPWLARQVAVAYLPSISALVTLRALPPSSGQRAPFIGFGDPDFGAGSDRAAAGRVRNLKIQHAPRWSEAHTSADAPPPAPAAAVETPALTPLPDTREEVLAIAQALAADPQRDVFLGPQASRRSVFGSDLKRRRIVAFATHGLVAGDLPGLDQPALALAAAPGQPLTEGLLRLDDILKLTLDADLVVLSACNTAAADGSGAEAVSGLGRGFFYAGARSVLATHWPVETVSARELVTRLFERYAREPQLTRAQALRQAMLALIDDGGVRDAQGRVVLAYAHPAFWAPYALYGDPGR